MKEHPIPQDITNYRFHIVGSMTLKQFGEAAVGVIIALAIYQTNLIGLLKWPLMIVFAGGGFAAAFIPIEERPLSHWISTFIGILYKPTQFFWKRAYNIPPAFLFKGDQANTLDLQELDLSPARRQRIKEFISSTNPEGDDSDFSPEERLRMSSILDIFQTQVVQEFRIEPQLESKEKPNLTVRVRSMRQTTIAEDPVLQERIASNALGGLESLDSTYVIDPEHKHTETNKKDAYLNTNEVAQGLSIPENAPVTVDNRIDVEEVAALVHQQSITPQERAFVEQTGPKSDSFSNSEDAQFNAALPFPSKPTAPNKLVGMILTPKDELIPGAIIEIKTSDGHVLRAVKSNALGQFFITTPLESGSYIVEVEKDPFKFHPLTITLTGKIVEPIEVRSN